MYEKNNRLLFFYFWNVWFDDLLSGGYDEIDFFFCVLVFVVVDFFLVMEYEFVNY